MSAKKTALMLLGEWANKEKSFSTHQRHLIREKIKELLPTERQQIEEAYNEGRFDESQRLPDNDTGSEYFTSTYETP